MAKVKQTKKEGTEKDVKARQRPSAALRTGKQEARTKGESEVAAGKPPVAAPAATTKSEQPQSGKQQARRSDAGTAPKGRDAAAIHGERSRTMATVALRGEQAARFRALAAQQGLSLAKLLVRMLDAFEPRAS